MMQKLQKLYRRLRLGEKFKHQYNCHAGFDIQRNELDCTILWKKKPVASIPYAHQLQNMFKGSCFIIASGPSLADIDLRIVAGYHTISLNCAIKKFNHDSVQPTHCIIVDHRVFERQWDCVKASILSGANCFFSYEGLSRICEREPELLTQGKIFLIESISRKFGVPRPSISECETNLKSDPEIFIAEEFPKLCRSVGFSTSLRKGLFSGKTVATWATQLGIALGYNEIFIIGMDLGGTGKKHFYADGNHHAPPDFMKDYEPNIRVCFEQAKRASLANGFKIYNLSEHSTLPHEIIEKIGMEQALSLAGNNQQE